MISTNSMFRNDLSPIDLPVVCAMHLSLIAMHNSRTVLIFRKPKSCIVSVVLLLIGVKKTCPIRVFSD